MSARSSRFSGFGSSRRRGKAAGAVIACAVVLLAGCGGSGEPESGAPVIRGDAPVAAAGTAAATLTVSNTTRTGTVGAAINLTYAGGSSTGTVSFASTGTGCTAIGASLSATTAGPCIVTATQVTQTSPAVTQTSPAVTFTFAAAVTCQLTVTGTPATNTYGTAIMLSVQSSASCNGTPKFASSVQCGLKQNSTNLAWYLSATYAVSCDVTATLGTAVSPSVRFTFTSPVIVKFNPNADVIAGIMNDQYAVTTKALLQNSFARPGFRFSGWATTPTGPQAYADKAAYDFTQDVTLYAMWVCDTRPTISIDRVKRGGKDSAIVYYSSTTADPVAWQSVTASTTSGGQSGSNQNGPMMTGNVVVRGLQRHTGYSFIVSATNYVGCSYTSPAGGHVDKFD